ncbi:MAG: 23S rRNA (guanosine(2251)-2'-O)-methyltransferase RlmB [Synechococcus sp.]|nr:23S rRNA (guanosine(2251)-2'-O)-methyltransferase RlmB [Synechococcus sp.]
MSPRFERRRGTGRPTRFSGTGDGREGREARESGPRDLRRQSRRETGADRAIGRSENPYQKPRDKPYERPNEKPYGERKPFGERKSPVDRRPLGERRPLGDRKPYDRRPGGRTEARFAPRRAAPPLRSAVRPLSLDGAPPQAEAEAERHSIDTPTDLVWGRHAAQAALESGRPIHRIWCTPEVRTSTKFLRLLREAKASGVLVEEVTWARLGQLTGGAVHQGITLQTAAADTLDLASLIEGCGALGEPPLLMALDGLTDPQNLGAIVRSAEALGAHGLVLPQRRSAGLTGSVAKVAAGALEHLPVARVVNLNRALDALKQEGYRVVGLAAEGALSLEEVDLEGPLVIVAGSEGDGLSMLTRRNCDQLVRIPLRGVTPSLNASVASALLLYEVARRGWMKGLRGSQPAPRLVRPQLPVAPAGVDSLAEAPGPQSVPESVPEPVPELAPKTETETETDTETEYEPRDDGRPVEFSADIQL